MRTLVALALLASVVALGGSAFAVRQSAGPVAATAQGYERSVVRVRTSTDELASRLADGWEVERVDRLPDLPLLVYVVRRPRP